MRTIYIYKTDKGFVGSYVKSSDDTYAKYNSICCGEDMQLRGQTVLKIGEKGGMLLSLDNFAMECSICKNTEKPRFYKINAKWKLDLYRNNR